MRHLVTLSIFALGFASAPLAWAAGDMQSADKPAMAASMPHDCEMMDMHGKGGQDMGGKDMGCMNNKAVAKTKAKAKSGAKPKAGAKKAAPEHDHETHTTK